MNKERYFSYPSPSRGEIKQQLPRLPWGKIREAFAGQWVELVDVDWDWRSPHPRRARVRNFADDRPALIEGVRASHAIADGVVLYIGNTDVLIEQHADGAGV